MCGACASAGCACRGAPVPWMGGGGLGEGEEEGLIGSGAGSDSPGGGRIAASLNPCGKPQCVRPCRRKMHAQWPSCDAYAYAPAMP